MTTSRGQIDSEVDFATRACNRCYDNVPIVLHRIRIEDNISFININWYARWLRAEIRAFNLETLRCSSLSTDYSISSRSYSVSRCDDFVAKCFLIKIWLAFSLERDTAWDGGWLIVRIEDWMAWVVVAGRYGYSGSDIVMTSTRSLSTRGRNPIKSGHDTCI